MSETGRPKVLDAIKKAQVCALVATGCSIRLAARYVCCSPATIHAEVRRDEGFAAQLSEAEVKREFVPLQRLREHSLKSWRAAAWFLERTVPLKYGRSNPSYVTEEQLEEMMQSLCSKVMGCIDDPATRKRIFKRMTRLSGERRKKRRTPKPKGRATDRLIEEPAVLWSDGSLKGAPGEEVRDTHRLETSDAERLEELHGFGLA